MSSSKARKLPGADALFGGSPQQSEEDKKTNTETRKQTIEQEPTPQKQKVSKEPVPKEKQALDEEEGLQRYTLFFRPETLEQLEEVWWRLRKKAADKRQFSKWRIVDAVLKEHLSVEHVRDLLEDKP